MHIFINLSIMLWLVVASLCKITGINDWGWLFISLPVYVYILTSVFVYLLDKTFDGDLRGKWL